VHKCAKRKNSFNNKNNGEDELQAANCLVSMKKSIHELRLITKSNKQKQRHECVHMSPPFVSHASTELGRGTFGDRALFVRVRGTFLSLEMAFAQQSNFQMRIKFAHRGTLLVLTKARFSDASAVADAVRTSLQELSKRMPWADEENAQTEAQEKRLLQVEKDFDLQGDKDLIFHLWHGEDRTRLLGAFGLHRRTLNSKGFEIGYWMRSDEAGKGIATICTCVLVVFCFDFLQSTRVQILHNNNNHASRRVIEKVGFIKEGELRNFETLTDVMKAAGASTMCSIYSLIPSDREKLDWVANINLKVEW